ncbi:hypothetical protein [Neolewinella agarilytica]|uniref:hypothetical protein n=1 Tax=Neolewinella agarilytica TaxID=478744 RepID=UPI002355E2FA|nr:hypothetical protein [Neolewinella agarilytica]
MSYSKILLFLCSITLFGCVSVPRLLEKGKYDRAYAVALKHCTRVSAQRPYSKARQKALLQFEDAYAAVQSRDYASALELRKTTDERRWIPLYELYQNLYSRSLDLLEYLPDTRELERHPGLRPAVLEAQREEARRKAGAYFLAQARPSLPAAFAGEKPAARAAFEHYNNALKYLPERTSTLADTLSQLRELGILRILLAPHPDSDYYSILAESTQSLNETNRGWTQIVMTDNGRRVDLFAEVSYLSRGIDGPYSSSSCDVYEKEVLDYVEKVKKKVKVNDSTYVTKITEIKHFKTITATVTTHEQSLGVTATALLSVYLPNGERAEWQQELYAEEFWSNEYSVCSGDRRALPAFACAGTYQFPPSTRSLLNQALSALPWRARSALIRRYFPQRPKRTKARDKAWG